MIVAVAKEREHKRLNARFYAKMTPEMRLYQIATESNIGDIIFKYIKEQSMTMGEEQLLRTINRMTSPYTDPSKSRYKFVVIDFSSWCTNFRYEFSNPIFKDLDDLFGFLMVYQYTHIFHMNSILLFQDRCGPPQQGQDEDPLPSRRCKYGPEAWQEGLRQKGWTLITIMLIQLAAEICSTTASLLGQGDNQVVLLKIPSEYDSMRHNMTEEGYVNNFVQVLSFYAEEAGIPIKPLETWQAHTLFEYSRRYHFQGAQVSTALKKVSRLASEANQVIPTLNGDISGMYSTGASAASEDVTPQAAYQTTLIESLHVLRRHYPWLRDRPEGFSLVMATVSRTLGGLPVTSYPNFCMRAVQDQLTSGLHWLRTLLRDTYTCDAVNTLVSLTRKNNPDFETLIKDPASLPLVGPLQSEHYLKDKVKQYLPNLIKNRSVKNLFDFNANEEKTRLVKDLISMTPFNPRLANKLYSLSNFGLQEKYLSKFSGARSIQQATLTAWTNESDVLASVKSVEKTTSDAFERKQPNAMVYNMISVENTCLTQLAQNLRDTMWGMSMERITMAAQQEQTRLVRWKDIPQEWASRAILIIVDASINRDSHITRGRNTPYYGSTTRLRVRRAPMQVLEVGNIVNSVKQLMEIRGWVKGTPEVTRLIDTLIMEKTTVSLDTHNLFTRQVYSGAISHRLPCQALKRGGMANQNLNFASHIRMISNTALHYAKSGVNHTICFQSAFLYALSTLSHLHESGTDIVGKWGLVFHHACCVREIPPETFDLARSEYNGVHLHDKLTEIRPKYELTKNEIDVNLDGEQSYSVIMGRRFALWIKSIQMSTRITSLENRAIHESLTAPFVNLTEFVHLNCDIFFKSLIYYHFLTDEESRKNPCLIWEPILAAGPNKTAYDVLIDSLVKCNLLLPWSDITGRRVSPTCGREGLRGLLTQTMSSICRESWSKLVIENSWITPDDCDAIHVRASYLLHMANSIMWIHPKDISYAEVRRDILREEHNTRLLPKHTTSEEEAICCVRQNSHPSHSTGKPQDKFPIRRIPLRYTWDAQSLFCNRLAGCIGHNLTNTSLYLMFGTMIDNSLLRTRGDNLNLYTIGDVQGESYTILYHVLMDWTCRKIRGHPWWSACDDDLELSLNKGPTHIALDTCKISYDKLRFQGNLSGRSDYNTSAPNNLFIFLTKRPDTYYRHLGEYTFRE